MPKTKTVKKVGRPKKDEKADIQIEDDIQIEEPVEQSIEEVPQAESYTPRRKSKPKR